MNATDFIIATKKDQDSMRAILHSHSQGSAELYLASTSLIRSSTLLHLGLINLSISHTRRNRVDSQSFILRLKSCCLAKWSMMNTLDI
uniref:Uncharacterized protein n=1 Tax=Salix viminalis TaxID=40686 RepID=A0A6N2LE18_SALVM